jgi:Asp/Glu/hydantoin racemase
VEAGPRIGVFATLESTLGPSVVLVERVAREKGKPVQASAFFCEDAFARLQSGDADGHDQILADCVHRAAGEIDVAVLAQASMARAESRLARELTIPVYGSLRLAVQRVRELVEGG